jgi:hypothetical protein
MNFGFHEHVFVRCTQLKVLKECHWKSPEISGEWLRMAPPPRPKATQRDPEEPIGGSHPRSSSRGREDGGLLAQREVLDQKVGPRRSETSEPIQDDDDSGQHRDRMEGCGSAVNDATGPDWR